MLNPKQHEKVARKCATAITYALDAFPELLAQADAETAAAIVADIIKTQLKLPQQQENPAEALAEIIRRAAQDDTTEFDSAGTNFFEEQEEN